MKKIILVVPVLLLAVACNQQTSIQQNTKITEKNSAILQTKTYTNSKYHFRMNVPKDSTVAESTDAKSVVFEKDDILVLSITIIEATKSLSEMSVEYEKSLSSYTIQKSDTLIGGQPAVRITYNITTNPDSSYNQKFYFFTRGDYFYEIRISPSLLLEEADVLVKSFVFSS